MKKYILSLITFFLSFGLFAQGDATEGNSDFMRSHLKLYVVIAVLGIILAGIFIFLFAIERRLAKLEKSK